MPVSVAFNFEVDLEGWKHRSSNPGLVASHTTVSPLVGAGSLLATGDGAGLEPQVVSPSITGLTPGETLHTKATFQPRVNKRSLYFYHTFNDSTGAWVATSPSTESKYISQSSMTVGQTVNIEFDSVVPAGAASAVLHIKHHSYAAGDETVYDAISVDSSAVTGTPPTANAGADLDTDVLFPVSLSGEGAASSGTIAAFRWRKVSGPEGLLESANSPTPRYTARAAGEHVLGLVVVDNSGLESVEDLVIVNVLSGYPLYVRRLGEMVIGRRMVFRRGALEGREADAAQPPSSITINVSEV